MSQLVKTYTFILSPDKQILEELKDDRLYIQSVSHGMLPDGTNIVTVVYNKSDRPEVLNEGTIKGRLFDNIVYTRGPTDAES